MKIIPNLKALKRVELIFKDVVMTFFKKLSSGSKKQMESHECIQKKL